MKASTFLEKLYDLGITPSNRRPRMSNDNAYSESLFKTPKFRPGFPINGFSTIEDAHDWVLAFVRWYNTEHRHSALNYVTPQQRHDGEADQILTQRKQVIKAAKAANPRRWSDDIRNFSLPESVTLNPEKVANC
jgi:putative transposase